MYSGALFHGIEENAITVGSWVKIPPARDTARYDQRQIDSEGGHRMGQRGMPRGLAQPWARRVFAVLAAGTLTVPLVAGPADVAWAVPPDPPAACGVNYPGPPAPTVDGFREIRLRTEEVAGWGFDCSGAQEEIYVDTAGVDHFVAKAGGYTARTHYARPRRQLPEIDDFAVRTRFVATFDFELPDGFYEDLDYGTPENRGAFLRLFTTDNHWGTYRTESKGIVGACDPNVTREDCAAGKGNSDLIDEWRVGFVLEGLRNNVYPKLVSAHEGHPNQPGYPDVLWRGEPLADDRRYTLTIEFLASKNDDGQWSIDINDGEQSDEGTRKTIPPSVPEQEALITRIAGGIDGAYNQDTQVVTVNLFSLDVRAK